MTDNEKLCYLAGIIDGDGCISIGKNIMQGRPHPIYNLVLLITSTNKDLIDFLYGNYGGIITGQPSRGNSKPYFILQLLSNNAIRILLAVKDKLIVRKQQAELALKFPMRTRESMGRFSQEERNERENIYLQLRKLNKKGTNE
jgi:hypothetical protein